MSVICTCDKCDVAVTPEAGILSRMIKKPFFCNAHDAEYHQTVAQAQVAAQALVDQAVADATATFLKTKVAPVSEVKPA